MCPSRQSASSAPSICLMRFATHPAFNSVAHRGMLRTIIGDVHARHTLANAATTATPPL